MSICTLNTAPASAPGTTTRTPWYSVSARLGPPTTPASSKRSPSSSQGMETTSRETATSRSVVGAPLPSRSRSFVARCGVPSQCANRVAPLRTKASLCAETDNRNSSLSMAKRVRSRGKSVRSARARFSRRARTDTAWFFMSTSTPGRAEAPTGPDTGPPSPRALFALGGADADSPEGRADRHPVRPEIGT